MRCDLCCTQCSDLQDLSCNEIVSLPGQMGELINLRILNVRKNVIQQLPAGLHPRLKSLTHTVLCLCISIVSSSATIVLELGQLRLKLLDFSCNSVQAIPVEFRHMDSIEDMVLDNNPLISPPAHVSTFPYVYVSSLLPPPLHPSSLLPPPLHPYSLLFSLLSFELNATTVTRPGF